MKIGDIVVSELFCGRGRIITEFKDSNILNEKFFGIVFEEVQVSGIKYSILSEKRLILETVPG